MRGLISFKNIYLYKRAIDFRKRGVLVLVLPNFKNINTGLENALNGLYEARAVNVLAPLS